MSKGVYNHYKIIGNQNATGSIRTNAFKKNASEKMKGKEKSEIHKENIKINHAHFWLGKKHSKEWIKNMSERVSGEGNPAYIDGRSGTKAYRQVYVEQYRSRKRGAEGFHTFDEWQKLKKQYNYTCPACGEKEPEIQLTEDHIVALIQGGTNYINNIQPLCRSCNSKKGGKTIFYE